MEDARAHRPSPGLFDGVDQRLSLQSGRELPSCELPEPELNMEHLDRILSTFPLVPSPKVLSLLEQRKWSEMVVYVRE